MADEDSVERTWTCLCGKFQAQVTGKPIFAACCYCTMCRKFMGGPFSLGIWTKMDISKGGGQDDIIKYVADEAKRGKTTVAPVVHAEAFATESIAKGISTSSAWVVSKEAHRQSSPRRISMWHTEEIRRFCCQICHNLRNHLLDEMHIALSIRVHSTLTCSSYM
jgi:hypothetical protein